MVTVSNATDITNTALIIIAGKKCSQHVVRTALPTTYYGYCKKKKAKRTICCANY